MNQHSSKQNIEIFSCKTNMWCSCLLQQADMVFTGLTINKERSEAVDFSYPFFEEPLTVVFRIWDHKESYFYKPLQWKVS